MNTPAIIFSIFLTTLAIIVESQKGRINWSELIPAIKELYRSVQNDWEFWIYAGFITAGSVCMVLAYLA